jgi:PAS domain S-box-containing protein
VLHVINNKYYLIFILISYYSIISGQGQEYKIGQITPEQGLSQSTVNCILQDKHRFMWFGTQNGLNKYNGYDFTVYKPQMRDSGSISNNVIRIIYEDSYGYLWAGTENGLNRYNHETEKFTHYWNKTKDTTSIGSNVVLSIVEDSRKQLWVGTKGGGLCKYDREENKFIRFYNEYSPESNNIYVIIEDNLNNDFILIGTTQGLYKFDKANEIFVPYARETDSKNKIVTNIRALSQDKDGNIYIGSWGEGLFKYNYRSNELTRYFGSLNYRFLKYNYVMSLFMDVQDMLWIGTRDGGLVKLNTANDQFSFPDDYSSFSSLRNQVIMSLYKSNSGIIWVGTKYYGIYKVVPSYKKFRLHKIAGKGIEDTDNNVITSVLVDSDDILWMGTLNKGLGKYDMAADKFRIYKHNPFNINSISSNNILTIIESSENNRKYFWIGTDGGGLCKFIPGSGMFINYRSIETKPNTLCNNHVYTLLEYDSEHLLIGTRGSAHCGGFDLFNYKTKKFVDIKNIHDSKDSFSSNLVYKIFKDRFGIIWIGTKGRGLNEFIVKNINAEKSEEIGEFKRYMFDPDNPESINNNDVLSIYEDKAGVLWIGTGGGGLNRFDRNKDSFTHFTEEDGLANNIVYGILEDGRNNLWISTGNGLSKFNPKTKEFVNYDIKDGLQDNVFNLGAYCKSKSGELYFGGVNGCNSFYPDSIKENLHIPEIIITKFLLHKKDTVIDARSYTNKSLRTLKEIKLPYNINDISFEFAALEYSSPLKNKYKYQLEGYNSDWIKTDASRRFANYTNLKHGRYLFKVIASNEDGNWNEEGTSISIIIGRPFWKSIWFILLLVAIATGILTFVMISWLKKYKLEKYELEKKVEESIFDERNQLRTLMDNMPDLIYIKDRQSRFILGNKKVAAVMGTIPKNLIGKTDFDFYTYELASRFYNDEQTLIKTGKPKINYEEPGLDEHGNRIILSTTKIPLKNKQGEVVGLVGIGRNITRLKNIEKELRENTQDLLNTNQLLEERQEEIQQQSEELAAQTENLRHANIELERLNKTKDKFFSIIAHDLKNPFHAIIGFSELLRKDFHQMDDEQKIGLLELINISSESAFSLLENLLQWARTQTDKIKFSPENIDIHDIVASTVDFHRISAEKKKIVIKSHVKKNYFAYADKNMITTVIRNLISNAIKFTESKGKIEIACNGDENFVEITISDNGIGINMDNLDNLFRIDSYYSTSGTLGESGTGLGLIICKEFIEKNKGTIKVESEEGKGSAFTFTLPAAKRNY